MAGNQQNYGSQQNDEEKQRDGYRDSDIRMMNFDVLGAYLRHGPINAVHERLGFDRTILQPQSAPISAGSEGKNMIRKWAQIMDPKTGIRHSVEVILDECTDVNWVHPSLVQNFHLETCSVDLVRHEVITGDTFESSKVAYVSWIGCRNQTDMNPFYVLPPKASLKMVVCKGFIDTYGRNVFMDEDPKPAVGPAYVTFQNTRTKEEEKQIGVGRAQAREDFDRLAREKEAREDSESRESKDGGSGGRGSGGRGRRRTDKPKGSSSKGSKSNK